MINFKNKRTMLFMAILLLSFTTCYPQEINHVLTTYFSEVKSDNNPAIPPKLFLPESAKATLSLLSPYLADSLSSVRAKAYAISHLAGTNAREAAVRELAVQQLIEGCKDNDSGNVGLALNYVTTFSKNDFTASAKDSIRSLVSRKPPYFDRLLKLAGYLELTEVKEQIRQYTQQGNTQQIRWAAIVSLARMSDAEALAEMMRRVRRLKVNDDVVYELFPDLIYSRQREAIDYLVQALNSDEKNCESADAESDAMIPCAYRIMEMLARVVEDYPLQVDASGDIKTKDYKKALATAREWFKKKGREYKINDDGF